MLKNNIKSNEKKLSELEVNRLKCFIEKSIMEEANNYEIKDKTAKIPVS